MRQIIPAYTSDPRFDDDDPLCEGCGVRPYSDVHHIQHKAMGGRHGAAKVLSEAPENKIRLCRVCHAASHGEHLNDRGFCCDLCPRLNLCRFGRQVAGHPYRHLRPPWNPPPTG